MPRNMTSAGRSTATQFPEKSDPAPPAGPPLTPASPPTSQSASQSAGRHISHFTQPVCHPFTQSANRSRSHFTHFFSLIQQASHPVNKINQCTSTNYEVSRSINPSTTHPLTHRKNYVTTNPPSQKKCKFNHSTTQPVSQTSTHPIAHPANQSPIQPVNQAPSQPGSPAASGNQYNE